MGAQKFFTNIFSLTLRREPMGINRYCVNVFFERSITKGQKKISSVTSSIVLYNHSMTPWPI